MSSIIFPITGGISLGAGMTDIKRIEDSVRDGSNKTMTAIAQTMQFHFATIMADEAVNAAGLGLVPFEGRLVGYLAPSIIALFISMEIDISCIRDCANFLQYSFGTLCQLAALVSTVALVVLGQLTFGITAAALITVGFLDRQKMLPDWISHPYHDYSPIVRASASLLVGGVVEKLFAVLSLVMFCYDKYINPIATPNENVQKQPLTLDLLDQILAETVELEVNPDHITLDILPPAPDVKIQELVTLSDTLPWESYLPMIQAKLKQDPRFLQFWGKVERYTDEQLVEVIKADLQKYVDSAVKRRMNGGEIHDYDRLEIYLKTITFQLLQESDLTQQGSEPTQQELELAQKESELIQINTLLRLAVEGGGYCGPEKFHVAEHLYCQFALRSKAIDPENKVLLRLQDSRTHWFEAEYHKRIQASNKDDNFIFKFLKSTLDSQDLHVYHIFLNLYGKKLGLRKASADNDYASIVDPVTKLAFKYFTSSIVDDFERSYTEKFICEHLQSGTGTSEMPTLDLYKWWKKWVKRQDISDPLKEELLEEIDYAKLRDKPMANDDPKNPLFEIPFLKAMALDLGILRIKAS